MRDEFLTAAAYLLGRELEKLCRRTTKPRWMRCRGDTCAGWKIWGQGRGPPAFECVMRCNTCSRFRDDESACTYVVRKLRKEGIVREAMCGSLECVACFWKLNAMTGRTASRVVPPSSMSGEERAVHVTLWAMVDEAGGFRDD